MTLPELTDWEATRTGLHQAAQVLAAVQVAGCDPLPNGLRYGLLSTPSGLKTRDLQAGVRLTLDYAEQRIRYDERQFSLVGQTRQSLAEAIFAALPGEPPALESSPVFEIDTAQAAAYARVQWQMHTALALLKAMFIGMQTPLVVWAHGFDLSTLWFMGASLDEERDQHVNFGFSPGTPDVGQPYVYFYVSPVMEGLVVPSLIQWHTAWATPGGIIPYDVLRSLDDPVGAILEDFGQIYEQVRDVY